MGTPFEDFVNDNLGVRMPLFIDTTTPALSSKAAGSLGSKFVDSSTNFLYEKTGFTNADWVKIAELGESRGGGGGGGMSYSNFTGGWNIEISGDSNLMFIETSKSLSGSGYFFDASGIIGTGDGMPFVVSESGQVGLNLYTGTDQASGYATPYQLHVSGVTALSGERDIANQVKPTLTVMGETIGYGNITATGTLNNDPPTSGKVQSVYSMAKVISGEFYRGDYLNLEQDGEFKGNFATLGDVEIGTANSSALGKLSVYGVDGITAGVFTETTGDEGNISRGAVRLKSGIYLSTLSDNERDNFTTTNFIGGVGNRSGAGFMIYNIQHQEFQVYDGVGWGKIVTGAIST